jgi:4-alpha-glucanotransferase
VLAVQLYAVRSRRNWGHGDFTDLAALIELAADVGASGIGLNPLHALFDEWADASPYAPNSRLFLNPRYIDVEAVPEFPGTQAADLQAEVARIRAPELIDYAGVIAAKTRALRLAFDAFQRNGAAPRREAFDKFRRQRGASLTQFATFEHLRRKFRKPWWEWPSEWRKPQADAAERLRAVEPDIVFYEFVQWIAHEQLAYCCTRARARVLPIGLYLDIAVGVRADSYDAWSDQDAMLTAAEVGAPPDLLNTAGQKWGVVGFNPVALVRRRCEPFRRMLRASMRYAGAIRLDHVMQLKRLFLIPAGMKADKGLYIRLPFEALLATTSHESRAHECIVIGEDLGTVPEGFREALAAWGLWSYQVLLFERDAAGRFRAPEDYPEKALATFATHDLPTFLGWRECHDLGVKRALGIDPGETEEERTKAQAALADALYARGLRSLDLLPVMEYLAATPSRMLAVTLEDVLGWIDQVNVPGTIDEHPNWRRRTGVPLEDFSRQPTLTAVAEIMAKAGRSIASA